MKAVKDFAGFFSGSLLALFIAAIAGYSQKPPDQTAQMIRMSVTTTDPPRNPCDEMAFMAGMNVMGESMAAMTNHMCITPIWPKEPGDEDKLYAAAGRPEDVLSVVAGGPAGGFCHIIHPFPGMGFSHPAVSQKIEVPTH